MFSGRVPAHGDVNALSRALAAYRADGVAFIDLTESNPTAVGLPVPDDLVDILRAAQVARYDPQPLGLDVAREAIAADYLRRGARVDPSQVVLSASSSESYSWLFKLLCDAGDAVLIPQPSYPLFEHLTKLEGVSAIPYQLRYHGRWEIDFDSVSDATAQVRALLVVSPNNPTGSFITREEARRLAEVCAARGWAIVADEVFAEYVLDSRVAATETFMEHEVLSFTLGGASKSLALPQIKLGWTVVAGSAADRARALAALEIIADTFLSVGTAVQLAVPALLARGEEARVHIRRRLTANLGRARALAQQYRSCTLLPVEGGWTLVVRVPATRSEEALAIELLQREQILVHPGYFFDFPHEAFLVVSLLQEETIFADAFERTLRLASTATVGS